MAHKVFISYSSSDIAAAKAACSALESNAIKCWIAPRDLTAGMNYGAAIVNAINESQVLVLILSTASNRSPQVIREVERAASKGVQMLTLRLEDMALAEDIEYFISSSHWLDATTPPLEKHLSQLAEAVGKLLSPVFEVRRNESLRLTVHFAFFGGSATPCCFINATNMGKHSDIEITHVWLESDPQVFALEPARPLPKRLKPLETWETWITVAEIPASYVNETIYQLARARLSTGEIISSVRNDSVPSMGMVPGGPITS